MSLKKKLIICGTSLTVLGAAILCSPNKQVDFPSYVDPIMEIIIEEEEPPLGNSSVTTKTTKKKSTKKVKLKKASKKTYTKVLPTKTSTSSNTAETGNKVVTTEKTVVTSTVEKYTKKKKYKKVTKTVTTTIKTTTSVKATDTSPVASNEEVDTVETLVEKYEIDAETLAPKMDNRVLSAYKTLGFKIYVDPSVTSYSGYFNAKEQTITLRSEDSTVYHELGHFLAFVANNFDRSTAFSKIYSSEKGLYTGVNKVYVTQSASEYFAESVRDYVASPDTLKAARPHTYEAIEKALNTITDAQVARIQKIYGAYWS